MNTSLVPFRFNSVMDSMFDGFDDIFHLAPAKNNTNSLKSNIREDENNYFVEVYVPGAAKEDLDIELNKNKLTISMSGKEVKETTKERYLLREINLNKVSRSFNLPSSVDENSIVAQLKDGILNLNLKKVNKTKKVLIN